MCKLAPIPTVEAVRADLARWNERERLARIYPPPVVAAMSSERRVQLLVMYCTRTGIAPVEVRL